MDLRGLLLSHARPAGHPASAPARAAALALTLALVGCGLAASEEQAPGGSERVVFLNFATGGEVVSRGPADAAARDVSQLCMAAKVARWEGATDCGGRTACASAVERAVRDLFAAYDITFTSTRPAADVPYTMVLVAPPVPACTFGHTGVAFADCGDRNPANLAFVFDCRASAEACAVLVAHELGHTLGLVHVLDGGDIMTVAPTEAGLRFLDEPLEAVENPCGVAFQNSHSSLLTVLGPGRRGP